VSSNSPKSASSASAAPRRWSIPKRILTQLKVEGYDVVPSYRRGRRGGGQHLRLHRFGRAESLDAIGEAMA
jgi:hypothetical protein